MALVERFHELVLKLTFNPFYNQLSKNESSIKILFDIAGIEKLVIKGN